MRSKPKRTQFGEQLRRWRMRREWTQAEMAKVLGVDTGTVGHWETDLRPSAELLLQLEFDIEAPVEFKRLADAAEGDMSPAQWDLWMKQRQRILRVSTDRVAGLVKRGKR